MRYFILNKNNQIKNIIKFLIKKDGLPKIQRRLNIFSDENFRIEILNNKICYRKNDRSKQIYIDNKNVKYFLKLFNNEKDYFINDINILKFKNCSVMFNTYHGTIISSCNNVLCKMIKEKFNLKCYDGILNHKEIIKPKGEKLFDNVGNLNLKIKEFAKKTGLDIRSTSASLKMRISNVGNDYTYLENLYKYITSDDLLSTKSIKKKYKISNMSITIPVYNQDVTSTLLSIEGQSLSREEKEKLQVIIINDGSKNDVNSQINKIRNQLSYELQIINLEKNMGLSNARNIGFSVAKYEHLLFLDSDIIISKNYIYDISIRLQLIPNALFVCMRRNIDKNSYLLDPQLLINGVDECFDFDDSRVITKGKKYHIGCDKNYLDEEIFVLDDTNYFKELGYGAQIGIYNISTVVTGHNMALNKSLIISCKPFCTLFKGWGMEDAYFASNLVANGCFVIPVLSSCVYHINHPPRSGSEKQKQKEAKRNYKIYNDLLNEVWK